MTSVLVTSQGMSTYDLHVSTLIVREVSYFSFINFNLLCYRFDKSLVI